MKRTYAMTSLLAACLLWPVMAAAIPYSSLYVFGDSLSDTGNMYAATGGILPPEPFYNGGRSSNGPLWVEQLAPRLGLAYDQSTNYAWLGAGTGYNNAWDLDGPQGINFFGLADQVDNYVAMLGGMPADPNALYVVWAGPNDFLSPLDPSQVPAAVANGVTNVATAVASLASMGAQHFLVPNMPELGITPRAIAGGVSDPLNAISQAYNAGLAQAMAGLGLDILMPDVAALMNQVVADPASYNFANVTDWCMNDLMLQAGYPPTICANPEDYLFWDSVHPTTAGHALLSDLFARTLAVPEPGTLWLLLVSVIIMVGSSYRQYAVAGR